jgi:phage terminase large subunit
MMTATIQPTRHRRVRAIAPYTPLPWQVAPWRDKSPVLLLTGSAGGGKSRLAAEKLHGYLLKYPGAAGLVARKTRVSLTNSTIEQFKRNIIGPDPRVKHVPSKSRFEYANGSMLLYVGIEDADQRERLRSIGPDGGIDIAWMEEATEFDEGDYNAVNGRLRGRAAAWRQLILTTNPDAPTHWIYRRLIVGGEAAVYYSTATDNTYNPDDYHDRLNRLTGVDKDRLAGGQWVQAQGLVYSDVWSDGPDDGNVTEAADYVPDGGPLSWAVDDGYAGERDSATGLFTANSHPRVFLLVQRRADGRLCVVAEHYAVKTLPAQHITDVLALPYPPPDFAVVDKSAATLKAHLHAAGIATVNGAPTVDESIKTLRGMLAPDANGWRRMLVHPRCRHLRSEFASYRLDPQTGKPIKEFDHGVDCCRYLAWSQRYD